MSTTNTEHLILIGTHSDHIYSVIFDPETRSLRQGQSYKSSPNPTWLTPHPTIPDVIYANGAAENKLYALRVKDREGSVEQLHEASVGGVGPCHMAVHPEAGVILAHYHSGTVTTIPISSSGDLASSTQTSTFTPPPLPPNSSRHPRQDAPHTHQIVIHPDGQEIFIPDLGSNKVWRMTWDSTEGKLREAGEALEGFEEGDGPRHLVFHPDGKHAYTLTELSSTLITHSLSSPSRPISRHSILPPSDRIHAQLLTAAEIVLLPTVTPDGQYLLIASNRDSPNTEGDALALFLVDPQDGSKVVPCEKQWVTGAGKHLRGVSADESGKWVCVTARNSDRVVMYERTGQRGERLEEIARLEGLDKPVCPLWIS